VATHFLYYKDSTKVRQKARKIAKILQKKYAFKKKKRILKKNKEKLAQYKN
jgi:hypothetical protein